MTYQTSEPVRSTPMNVTSRPWGDLIRQVQHGDTSYDPPYQRGPVWSGDQRIMLIYSILADTPVPALIMNYRPASMWFAADGSLLPSYAVIDGKQRLMSVQMFMEDELAVPASWFPADHVTATEDTGDGPYVRYSGLALPARRFFENTPTPVAEASVKTVPEEAAIYLRVNGSGTPQTGEDLARATGVAASTAAEPDGTRPARPRTRSGTSLGKRAQGL